VNFLIDTGLPAATVDVLRRAGHDAIHVRRYGIHKADDEIVFDRAVEEARVLVSADARFTMNMAMRNVPNPSVIAFRGVSPLRVEALVKLLLANLPSLTETLHKGSLVVFESNRLRVRPYRAPKVTG
jgi:predicted nuclease of predicted toxin-antitoxin system